MLHNLNLCKFDGSNIGHIDDYNLKSFAPEIETKSLVPKVTYPLYITNLGFNVIKKYQSMKCDIFNLIIDELKQELKISYIPKARIFKGSLESSEPKEIMLYKISEDFISISKFKDLDLLKSQSFVYEMRRLIIFRYLMCLNCNNDKKRTLVKISSSGSLSSDREELLTSIIPKYPVSVEEISFEKDSATVFSDKISKVSDSFEIPETLIEKWFTPSKEQISLNISNHDFFYDSIKDFLVDVDISEFRDRLRNKIHKYMKEYRERKHSSKNLEEQKIYALKEKKIEKLLWWSNAVYERIRQYK